MLKSSAVKKSLEKYRQEPNLDHFLRMTTKYGFMQHAIGNQPDDRFGYSIDDNARAIIVTILYDQLYHTDLFETLGKIYLDYLFKAKKSDGSYHNFADREGKFIDEVGSLDSQGRVAWAYGAVLNSVSAQTEIKEKVKNYLEEFIFYQKPFIRSRAFALLGFCLADDLGKIEKEAKFLVQEYKKNSSKQWQWFEDILTYSNAILPWSLITSGKILQNQEMIEIGTEAYQFLNKISRYEGKPAPIGCNGWYPKGGEKALYDQQVVDVADMVLLSIGLYEHKADEKYLDNALDWMSWFDGNNSQKSKMLSVTGGVYDGITPNGHNTNQGAESVILYLIAYLKLAEIAQKH